MSSIPATQKRPRTMISTTDDTPLGSDEEMAEDRTANPFFNAPPSYADCVLPRRPKADVRVKDLKSLEEIAKIKVAMATKETPFKQVTFDDDLAQWKDAIIIKVLGKPWAYLALMSQLESLWNLEGKFEFLDLGYGCFCLKDISAEKREYIMTEGPWQIAGSFLSIRTWKPNFRADKDRVDTAITWVRILNLPMEMFRDSVICTLAECIGEPIKIDGNTFTASKGKFARFCVQINTDVPLELGILVDGKVYQVVYENLHSICYKCGKVGHVSECKEIVGNQEEESANVMEEEGRTETPTSVVSITDWLTEKAKNKEYGEWMQVIRKKKPNVNEQVQASRFGYGSTPQAVPQARPQAHRRPTQQRTNLQTNPGRHQIRDQLRQQLMDHVIPTTRNPNGRVLPSSILGRNSTTVNTRSGPSTLPSPGTYNFHVGSGSSTPTNTNTSTQNQFSVLCDTENNLASHHSSESMRARSGVGAERVRNDDRRRYNGTGRGKTGDSTRSKDGALSDTTNQVNQTDSSGPRDPSIGLGGGSSDQPGGNGGLQSRENMAKTPDNTIGTIEETCDVNGITIARDDDFRRNFRDLVRTHHPDIVYVLETRVGSNVAESIASNLGFTNHKLAPTDGMDGGIWMLWNEDNLDVDFVEVEDQGIHAVISRHQHEPWLISGIYAKPRKVDKLRIFSQMRRLSAANNLPWLATGDFNEICFPHEKSGGRVANLARCLNFQNWIHDWGLIDLGFQGPSFTWSNKREGWGLIEERIDRALGNEAWCGRFPHNSVQHLPRTYSDHHPILINTIGNDAAPNTKPFRFENIWFNHKECKPLIQNIWACSADVTQAIGKIPEIILPWNKERFGNLFCRKRLIKARLDGIQRAGPSQSLAQLEKKLLKEFNTILQQEERFWHQKSRIKWLQEGERNTKFFHQATLTRFID
ncbi:hypothetical protein OROHE_012568 [Orobanche hederae]